MILTKPQKVGAKGTVLIPKKIRDKAGIKSNSSIIFKINSKGQLILDIIQDPVEELQSMFANQKLPSTQAIIDNFRSKESSLDNKKYSN